MRPEQARPAEAAHAPRHLPWHWLLWMAALLAAGTGAWSLWGPMPVARPLPPSPRELFQLKEVANAADLRSLQHRQVILVGRFTGHPVVLKGRDMAGRRGYDVLEPLVEKGPSGLAVLVQRGWVPSSVRNLEQAVTQPMPELVIEGRLAFPRLGADAGAASETGLIRQSLDLERYAREIGVPLVPLVVPQEPGSEWSEKDIRNDFYQRRWSELYPQDEFIARHGWRMLGLALVLALLGVWMGRKRRQVQKVGQPP